MAYEAPLLFDKWDLNEVVVNDKGLENYINLEPVIVAHSGARHANRPFGNQKVSIVERVINELMRGEKFTGKKHSAYKAVRDAFDIVHDKLDANPVQVLVEALENSAPREEVTRLRYGGISVPKAVDTAPGRRLDTAIRNVCTGAVNSSHKNPKGIAECLAQEIIQGSKNDQRSYGVSRKDEVERVAKSAR